MDLGPQVRVKYEVGMKVIVSLDGSEHSLRVLPAACQFAEAAGATLTLLRVLDPKIDLANVVAPSVQEAIDTVTARWREEMEQILQKYGAEGEVEIRTKGRAEDVYRVILRAAKASESDMLAMTSRGASLLRHAILGSVGMQVLGNTDVPVMLASGELALPEVENGYHIVVTDDGSPSAISIFDALAPIVVPGRMRLTLLTISGASVGEPPAREMEARLRALAGRFAEGVDIQLAVREVPALSGVDTAIVRFAEEVRANAIAMATHGHSARRHLVAGSVAMGVLKHAKVPVILSRRGR